jgi:hypothetical protein
MRCGRLQARLRGDVAQPVRARPERGQRVEQEEGAIIGGAGSGWGHDSHAFLPVFQENNRRLAMAAINLHPDILSKMLPVSVTPFRV